MTLTLVKEQILEKLALVIDEPEIENLQFDFDEYAKHITEFLTSTNMPSPFVMAIHGEWGSGKTTLIKKIKSRVDGKIQSQSMKNWKTLEFDAWEYEKTDVVSSLLQKIHKTYENEDTESVKKFAKAIGSFILDAALRKTIGLTKEETKEHFQEFFENIETIRETTEGIVEQGRLIVFVDDLDRCLVDNVLEMLEAIKMFLSVKNVIFVIAVDMEKIERAWELRYNSEQGTAEGRAHVEKLFQLKLSLPPKDEESLYEYLRKMASSFADSEIEFILKNCPPNPRKIKRLLNLIYFILTGIEIPGRDDKEQNKMFETLFPIIITWASLTLYHPHIAKIIKHSPSYLIQLAVICNEAGLLDKLKKRRFHLEEYKRGETNLSIGKMTFSKQELSSDTVDGLQYIIEKDPLAFKTLKNFGFYVGLKNNREKSIPDNMQEFYSRLSEPIRFVISSSGLVGI